jgi:hypothetical protein
MDRMGYQGSYGITMDRSAGGSYRVTMNRSEWQWIGREYDGLYRGTKDRTG